MLVKRRQTEFLASVPYPEASMYRRCVRMRFLVLGWLMRAPFGKIRRWHIDFDPPESNRTLRSREQGLPCTSLTTIMALAMGVDLPRWSTVNISSGSDTIDSWVSWQLISSALFVPVLSELSVHFIGPILVGGTSRLQ